MEFYNAKNQAVSATVRRATPEDAGKIVRLVSACYGTVCSDKTMYDVDKLAAMIQSGERRIVLAEDSAEQALGMEVCCTKAEFPDALYLQSKMTHPDYRQYGIAREITRQIMQDIQSSGFDSAFAYALTYNDISQSILIGYQFVMTGLLYNTFLKSEDIPDCTQPMPKRSHAIMVRNMGVSDVGKLYLPEEYHAIARQIYASLGVSMQLESNGTAPEGATSCRVYDIAEHQNTEIFIDKVGEDMESCLQTAMREYHSRPLQTYHLFLNILDSSAISAVERLQTQGFICSGFQPLGHGREYLAFYASPSVEAHPDYLKIHPNFLSVQTFFIERARARCKGDNK